MNFFRLLLPVLAVPALALAEPAESTVTWETMNSILARIQAPQFPDRDFPVTDFGARADGRYDSSEAIRQAIEACHQAGGGRVVLAGGVFLTGAVHLLSNVNLHIAEGATLQFIPDPERYLPLVRTRFEGTEVMNFSPLIYALDQENVAVTGGGTLDGSASDETWWKWARRVDGKPGTSPAAPSTGKLLKMADDGVPPEQRIFGPGEFLRPNFVQFYRCRNVLVEGVRIINSPMWVIHPVFSTNVTVRGVAVTSHGPNNDGCNPDSSRDVLIENCIFDTGDDCVAIKSGKNDDGRRLATPSENIVVRNCVMKDGHGGVVMGSECSGDIRNVFVEHCRMDSPNLDRALRFKSNGKRGGVIENIFMRHVQVGRVAHSVVTVDFLYDGGNNGPHLPVVRNVHVENVTSDSSPRALWMRGFPGVTIDGFHFSNCEFRGVEGPDVIDHVSNLSFSNVTVAPVGRVR
jgi:polygalacturonase